MMTTTMMALLLAAQDPGVSTTTTMATSEGLSAESDWRAGLGLAFGFAFGFLTPGIDVVAEHRVGAAKDSNLFAGVSASGGIARSIPLHEQGGDVAPTQSYSAAVDVTARQVLNAGSPLEVSGFASLGGAVRNFDEQVDAVTGGARRENDYSVAGALGASVEHWFTPLVAVRMSSTIVTASATWLTRKDGTGAASVSTSGTAFGANIGLQPAVSVVVGF